MLPVKKHSLAESENEQIQVHICASLWGLNSDAKHAVEMHAVCGSQGCLRGLSTHSCLLRIMSPVKMSVHSSPKWPIGYWEMTQCSRQPLVKVNPSALDKASTS